MLNTKDHPSEFFDLSVDPYEKVNLLPQLERTSITEILGWTNLPSQRKITLADVTGVESNGTSRRDSALHQFVVAKIYNRLKDFAEFGNEGHINYLKENPGRIYTPTVESDTRYANGANIYKKISRDRAAVLRKSVILEGTCSTPCSCKVPSLYEVATLPFSLMKPEHHYINPSGCINATRILFG